MKPNKTGPLRLSQRFHSPLCPSRFGFRVGLLSISLPSLNSLAFAVPKTWDAFPFELSSSLRSQLVVKTFKDLIYSSKAVAITSPYFNSLQNTYLCYFSLYVLLVWLSPPKPAPSESKFWQEIPCQSFHCRTSPSLPQTLRPRQGCVLREGGSPESTSANKALQLLQQRQYTLGLLHQPLSQ